MQNRLDFQRHLETARRIAHVEGGHHRLVRKLAEGKGEEYWDHACILSHVGEIKRPYLLDALAHGLPKLHNKYSEKHIKRELPRGWYRERMLEIEKALSHVHNRDQKIVTFRGFWLDKQGYLYIPLL